MTIEYLTLADRSLAYQRQVGNNKNKGVLFLGGFASDMEGNKATFITERCAEAGLGCVRFDYRGCGVSPGRFAEGTIGAWLKDTLAVFDQLTQGEQIVVGSSMGGWLGLLLARARPERVKAFVGIAAAPDVTEELIWDKLPPLRREAFLREGVFYENDAPPDRQVPITLDLIQDGRQHLVFRSRFALSCPIRLLQGMNDKEVPWTYASRIADHVEQDDIRVTLVKNGDHRLSAPKDLDLLWQTVAEFI